MSYLETWKKANLLLKENENLEKEIEKLSFTDELKNAAVSKNLETYKKYSDLADKNIDKMSALFAKIEFNRILAKVLKSNAKIEFFNETRDQVKDILVKYDGKAYGPKTKEKIRLEIKEKCNVYFCFINKEYATEVYMYANGNPHDFKVEQSLYKGSNSKSFLNDNRINAKAFLDLEYGKIIEDPETYTKGIIDHYKKLEESLKAAKSAYSDFTKDLYSLKNDDYRTPDNIPFIYNLNTYI